MKLFTRIITTLLSLTLCVFILTTTCTATAMTITPYKSTIFGNYSVTLSTSMIGSFRVTTRKPVSSVAIAATMQVQTNGVWKNYSTNVYPSFSGTDKIVWTTTADYSGACNKGDKYRLVVTYSSNNESVSYTTSAATY